MPDVTVCGRMSSFVHTTVSPISTDSSAGTNCMPLIATWYVRGHRLKLTLEGSEIERRRALRERRVRAQLEFFL